MKKSKLINRVAAASLAAVMMVGMTGCGSNNVSYKPVYSDAEAENTSLMIGDYQISNAELMVYAIQELTLYTGNAVNLQTEENQNSHKNQVLGLVRETKILYDVALHNNVELSETDLEAKDKLVNSFKNAIPQKVFDKYGITDAIIDQVFTERTFVEKFENDIKNDMGQNMTNDVTEAMKDYNFVKMYYMTFPTVEVLGDAPKTDENGDYVYLSAADKKKVKEDAEKAVEEIKSGKDAEEVAAAYGVDTYSVEQKGYVGSFGDEIDKLLDGCNTGDVTEPFEDTLGYVVIYIKSAHDQDIMDSYVYGLVSDSVQDQMEVLEQKWLSTIEVDEEKDIVGDDWAEFDILDMSLTLEDAGVIVAREK